MLILVVYLHCNPQAEISPQLVDQLSQLMGRELPMRRAHPDVINRLLAALGSRRRVPAMDYFGVVVDLFSGSAELLDRWDVVGAIAAKQCQPAMIN